MKYKWITSICLVTVVVIVYIITIIVSDNTEKAHVIAHLADVIYTKPEKSEYLILAWTIRNKQYLYWFGGEPGYNH